MPLKGLAVYHWLGRKKRLGRRSSSMVRRGSGFHGFQSPTHENVRLAPRRLSQLRIKRLQIKRLAHVRDFHCGYQRLAPIQKVIAKPQAVSSSKWRGV